MCSIVFFLIFKNKIYNTYYDLHTRIILNNVLKITIDIVENAPPRTSSCARINYEFMYNQLEFCNWLAAVRRYNVISITLRQV